MSRPVEELIAAAIADGASWPPHAITGNLGSVVVAGAPPARRSEDITASDVTLLITLLVDASWLDSRSPDSRPRCATARTCSSIAFAGSKERDAVLMALWTFNAEAKVLHGYLPVDEAVRLDVKSYRGAGATCLYDTWCDGSARRERRVRAAAARPERIPCRSVVVVVTDGEDVGSRRTRPRTERASRATCWRLEQFTLAFVGVGQAVDFEAVAAAMGVPKGCVLRAERRDRLGAAATRS